MFTAEGKLILSSSKFGSVQMPKDSKALEISSRLCLLGIFFLS